VTPVAAARRDPAAWTVRLSLSRSRPRSHFLQPGLRPFLELDGTFFFCAF
jgi:hypothetical protein